MQNNLSILLILQNNLKQFPDLLITHATASAFPDGHLQISFDFSFLFFQHRLLVRTGNEAAFPMKQFYQENYPGIVIEKGNIDELITIMIQGEKI